MHTHMLLTIRNYNYVRFQILSNPYRYHLIGFGELPNSVQFVGHYLNDGMKQRI